MGRQTSVGRQEIQLCDMAVLPKAHVTPQRAGRTGVWMALVGLGAGCAASVWGLSGMATPARAQAVTPAAAKPTTLSASAAESGIPITFELATPQHVTVVIEDVAGKRVRNLVSETRMPAGKNSIVWDGYDDGVTKDGVLTRRRVEPGVYHARGLTHDGLKTIYEFPVYSGGKTPWPTDDNTGGWLADHSSTLGATFIPSGSPYGQGKPQVMLLARIAECGAPMVWVGTDGETYQRRPLWGWEGGDCAATDFGKDRDPRYYAYVLIANPAGKDPLRIRGLSVSKDSVGQGFFDVKKVGPDVLSFTPTNNQNSDLMREAGMGLSVLDGLAAFAVSTDNAVVFGDIKTGRILGTVEVPAAKGVLLLSRTRLLVSTQGTVKQYEVKWDASTGAPGLAEPGKVVIDGLEDPRTLQTDLGHKYLYVADWGKSNQVKVYDASTYKAAFVVGQPGGKQLGAYNELQMQKPNGLAIDDAGQLWVAEAEWMPKRVSVWDAKTGVLRRAIYGPPHYGGGGTIDPTDKTRLFYGEFGCTLEFKLDWKAGSAKLVAVPVRLDVQNVDHPYGKLGYGPEVPWVVNGRTYLTLCYQTSHRSNDNIGIWLYDQSKKTARPVSYVGSNTFWVRPNGQLEKSRYEQLRKDLKVKQFEPYFGPLTNWTDLNGDGRVTRDEMTFRLFPEKSGAVKLEGGHARELAGFNFYTSLADLSLCGSWNTMLPPPTFREDGTPVYDLGKTRFMVEPSNEQCWEEDGNTGILTEDGFWNQGFKGYKDGKLVWSYPVDGTPGVPPRHPGDVVEPTRLMGPYFKMSKGEAGILGITNGERGNMYVMTSDGLFVQTIGAHRATAELFRFPKAERGMDVSGYSFEDEHFHPTVTHTSDDEVYMVAGKEYSAIFRIDGLQSVKRRQFGELSVTAKDLANIPEKQVFPARQVGRGLLTIEIMTQAPVVDGKLDEWTGADWVKIGSTSMGAMAIRGDRLYAAWKTGNPKVLLNMAADPEFAFKRGGAVDILVGPENRWAKNLAGVLQPRAGDLRLLACEVDGKKLAVLYRQVAGSDRLGRPVLYESPIGKVQFDDVAIVSDQVELAQANGNVELSVPLKLLGVSGNAGDSLLGDMGILRGSGSQTTLRTYWNNMDTAMVSDIPSEARLSPAKWGQLNVGKGKP